MSKEHYNQINLRSARTAASWQMGLFSNLKLIQYTSSLCHWEDGRNAFLALLSFYMSNYVYLLYGLVNIVLCTCYVHDCRISHISLTCVYYGVRSEPYREVKHTLEDCWNTYSNVSHLYWLDGHPKTAMPIRMQIFGMRIWIPQRRLNIIMNLYDLTIHLILTNYSIYSCVFFICFPSLY